MHHFRFLIGSSLVAIYVMLVAGGRASGKDDVVAGDGSADFKSVQAAIDAIPDGDTARHVIIIRPGVYKELVKIGAKKPQITLRGDDADPAKTTLTFDLFAGSPGADGKNVGTSGSTSTLVQSDNFIAEKLTFENPSGEKGQAVAVRTTGDRMIFRNCRFIGGQDTLYPNGKRTYFKDCYIEGRADFIFGRATAVFENCELHSKNGGFVTAPSTLPETKYGFVFLHCRLTGTGPDKAHLGRPWRDYGASAYINCEIGDHIAPAGWNNWLPAREKTARFAEYGNTGPGSDTAKRVPWAKQLTREEAAEYTVPNILGGEDHWDPTALLAAK